MKRKKLTALLLALCMLLMLALAACGSTETDTAEEAETTEAAEETETAEETEEAEEAEESSESSSEVTVTSTEKFTFTLTCHDPETASQPVYIQEWCDKVYEVTNGGVTINCVWSGALATAADAGDMVKSQGCDIGWLYIGYYAGQYPLSEVLNLPMQGFGDPIVSTEVLWALTEGDYPEVMGEWEEDYKVLMFYANPGMMFYSNVELNSMDDLQGLSIRCPAGAITDVLADWGASPITMATGDIYQAVEKNNIQGYIFEPSGVSTFSLQEVTTYAYDYQMYDGVFCLAMNWDRWNELPEDYQAAIDSISGYEASIGAAEAYAIDVDAGWEEAIAAGVEVRELSDEMIAEMQEIADVYAEEWAATLEGVDGAAFLETAKALAAEYSE